MAIEKNPFLYSNYMELRVVEVVHAKRLTTANITKQISISRVSLSNSLNGNPTLSRLREVIIKMGSSIAA